MSIEIVEDGTGKPQYLMIYSSGPILAGSIHEMIDQYVKADGALQAVYLITPDGSATQVDITDVNNGVDDVGPYGGFEWEVVHHSNGRLVEYIGYTDDTRKEYESHNICVHGFPA